MVMAQQRPSPRTPKTRRTPKTSGRTRLSARDWADAALAAMRRGGGLSAVAVEPLAAAQGGTKGSFYWHFANREALVAAALERWAELETEAVIAEVAGQSDPEARIRRLFTLTTYTAARDPVELALLADAAHPQVAVALRLVTERRLDYLTELFGEFGLDAAEARHRALLAYASYLGHAQLAHSVRDLLPGGAEAERYLDTVLETLLRR
jgi:AcrR family transcriptional regulator